MGRARRGRSVATGEPDVTVHATCPDCGQPREVCDLGTRAGCVLFATFERVCPGRERRATERLEFHASHA